MSKSFFLILIICILSVALSEYRKELHLPEVLMFQCVNVSEVAGDNMLLLRSRSC